MLSDHILLSSGQTRTLHMYIHFVSWANWEGGKLFSFQDIYQLQYELNFLEENN